MLPIHLLDFFLLVSPADLLPSAFDVLDIHDCLGLGLSLPSELVPVLLLGHELSLLVFVQPRNVVDVDLVLLEGSDVFADDFFDPGNPEEVEGIGDLANVDIFKLKDVPQIVLLIGSDVGDKCLLCFFDIVSITGNYLI